MTAPRDAHYRDVVRWVGFIAAGHVTHQIIHLDGRFRLKAQSSDRTTKSAVSLEGDVNTQSHESPHRFQAGPTCSFPRFTGVGSGPVNKEARVSSKTSPSLPERNRHLHGMDKTVLACL